MLIVVFFGVRNHLSASLTSIFWNQKDGQCCIKFHRLPHLVTSEMLWLATIHRQGFCPEDVGKQHVFSDLFNCVRDFKDHLVIRTANHFPLNWHWYWPSSFKFTRWSRFSSRFATASSFSSSAAHDSHNKLLPKNPFEAKCYRRMLFMLPCCFSDMLFFRNRLDLQSQARLLLCNYCQPLFWIWSLTPVWGA